ncbi:MAG: helix-turn-helix transcriptional regulator [Clostridiales bacterium]|nr:helix-turn-helix transcriptional regulator [Clostridiales bacterium]
MPDSRTEACKATAQKETCRLVNEMSFLRQEANLTQKQFAKQVGISYRTIQTTEEKKNVPNLRTFCLFLDALGYKLEIAKK